MPRNVELFTTRMRKATRKIQSVSEALINAKFAIALHDETVWSGCLLHFYEVFAFLEDAKERLNDPDINELFVHPILYRKQAFEEDLHHYFGKDWRYQPTRPCLGAYLQQLQCHEWSCPMLLMAYVYNLYLGLLSGGQILAKQRRMFGNKNNKPNAYVDKVTDFSEVDISQLKNDFRDAMNKIANTMNKEQKDAFIAESNMVFWMNNVVIDKIHGQNRVLKRFLYTASAILVLVYGAVLAYKMM